MNFQIARPYLLGRSNDNILIRYQPKNMRALNRGLLVALWNRRSGISQRTIDDDALG